LRDPPQEAMRGSESMRIKARVALAGVMCVALAGTFFATAGPSSAKTTAKAAAAKITYKNLSYKDFSLTYAAMKDIKPLAAKGKGSVAVILPDTTSSTRYTEFDAPMLKTALTDAGLKPSQIIIQNAQASDATFIP